MAETTTTKKIEISSSELNDLLNIPGADNVILPEEKPGFFSKGSIDMGFLTKKEPKVEKIEKKTGEETDVDVTKEKPGEHTSAETTQFLQEISGGTEPVVEKGRPKVNKEGIVELTKKFIEKGILVPFDDDKKIEEYTISDFEELFEANQKDKEERIKAQTPVEFFDSLPTELQYAAKYVADGGTDLKGLFSALAQVEQVRELSAEDPKDHETIIKEYLTVTNFGTPEDIDEEISTWKDLNKLEEKAEKFKPKLDQMRQEQVTQRLAQQEASRAQQIKASQNYQASVYEILKPGEIGGLKLDKKTQGMLYSGLVQPQYPSISGRPTNLLGHLLEKYQFVEPDHKKIAKVLWLLADEEGFENEVKKQAKTETTEAIVRKLKTEETKKIGSSAVIEKDETRTRTIQRNNNFFKR